MRPPDPVVFVLGATGYVGTALVLELARHDHVRRVVAHVRPGSAREGELRERVAGTRVALESTPLEAAPIAETLDRIGPTHLFLCHGTTARRARTEGIHDPYQAVDVGLTRLLVDAAARLERDPGLGPRVVYLSAVGTSAGARSPYLAARWRAEELIRASGLPYTICRAPLLSGPDRSERRPAETWARRLFDPTLTLLGAVGLGRLRDRYRSMDAAEAAEGLCRSGFHYMTINRVVESDELRSVGVYERERWTPASRRDTDRF